MKTAYLGIVKKPQASTHSLVTKGIWTSLRQMGMKVLRRHYPLALVRRKRNRPKFNSELAFDLLEIRKGRC